jgi:hypothetical protein
MRELPGSSFIVRLFVPASSGAVLSAPGAQSALQQMALCLCQGSF